jgi:hypothetical protein
MCNSCDCDNYEKCSIVGYQPYGACCPECRHYDEAHSCARYALKYVAPLISEDVEVPVGEKSKIIALSREQFP